ncbi:MAG: hypothetical protein OEV53_05965 [Nitrospira sp.]|nr:hypothetical protein [Nitrospira sp.]
MSDFIEQTGSANPFTGIDLGDDSALAPNLGDLDGDGDLDLVVGNDGGTLRTFLNSNRAPVAVGDALSAFGRQHPHGQCIERQSHHC